MYLEKHHCNFSRDVQFFSILENVDFVNVELLTKLLIYLSETKTMLVNDLTSVFSKKNLTKLSSLVVCLSCKGPF